MIDDFSDDPRPAPSPARQRYLDLRARCHQAFTPFAPIELPDFFAGRLDVVQRINRELEAPGRHVAIFGERGVGKTSLAELLSFFNSSFRADRVQIVRCDADSTFEMIFGQFLARFGEELALEGVETTRSRDLGWRPGAGQLSFGRSVKGTYKVPPELLSLGKDRLVQVFSELEALLIIDEYDRVSEAVTHRRLAELIKALSDSRSTSKIVIVGVADSLRELVGEHPSLSRSLAQVRLERMSRQELTEIVKRGEDRTGVRFLEPVVQRIVVLADGFPQFVHLICLYAALEAVAALVRDGEDALLVVGEVEYASGLQEAIENSEQSLRDSYEEAVVTTRRRTDLYELVLQAIAVAEGTVVQVREIADHASRLAGREINPNQLGNALGRLISDDRGKVLTKVRVGYYKFTNPLMRPYIRLLLENEFDGQSFGV